MKILQSYSEMMCMGIYKITNTINGNCYVGSSKVVYHRIKKHELSLKANKHANQHLQNAYNKYGSSIFTIELIEVCEESKLQEREQWYIDLHNAVYNKRTAFRNSPIIQSTKDKISIGLKNYFTTENSHRYRQQHKWKPVYLFDLNGRLIKEFESPTKCAIFLQIAKQSVISAVNKNKGVIKNKYLASYEKELSLNFYKAKITNLTTDEIFYFISDKAAMDKFEIPFSSYYRNLNKVYKQLLKIERL